MDDGSEKVNDAAERFEEAVADVPEHGLKNTGAQLRATLQSILRNE